MNDKDQNKRSELPSVTISTAGIQVEGRWNQLADFCEKFTQKLEDLGKEKVNKDELKDWEDWEPREGEREEDLRERTAKEARFKSKTPPGKELKKSASAFNSLREALEKGELEEAIKDFSFGSLEGLKAVIEALGNLLGQGEELIYRYIITPTNPLYFDTSLISAKLERLRKLAGESPYYRLTIKVQDPKLEDKILRNLK